MRASLSWSFPITLALLGCTARSSDGGVPPNVHADGETGLGTFVTQWGTAQVDYQWVDGLMVHDGDIVLDPDSALDTAAGDSHGLGHSQQALLQASKKWEMVGGVVKLPYSFAPELSDGRKQQIRHAMDEWEGSASFLKFVESSATEGRRVRFVEWGKHYCYVNGSANDEVKVYTNGSCTWITYVHELGHVLGFMHEQKRDDRETYVSYDKSKTCMPSEFSFHSGNKLGAYDANSIMHYPSCLFAQSTGLCGGSGACSEKTPQNWVLTRKTAYGPAYIPSWSGRSAGKVLSDGDQCNFKSLYGLPCNSGSGGTGGTGGVSGAGGASGSGGSSEAGAGGAGGDPSTGGTQSGGAAGAGTEMGGAAGAAGSGEEVPAPEPGSNPAAAGSTGKPAASPEAQNDGGCSLMPGDGGANAAASLATLWAIGLVVRARRRSRRVSTGS